MGALNVLSFSDKAHQYAFHLEWLHTFFNLCLVISHHTETIPFAFPYPVQYQPSTLTSVQYHITTPQPATRSTANHCFIPSWHKQWIHAVSLRKNLYGPTFFQQFFYILLFTFHNCLQPFHKSGNFCDD